MKIENIYYGKSFEKLFKKLPKKIQLKALEKEKTFRKNAFHPSLRLHKLSGNLEGLWSISVDIKNRIVFSIEENGDVLFISIGTHAIYKK